MFMFNAVKRQLPESLKPRIAFIKAEFEAYAESRTGRSFFKRSETYEEWADDAMRYSYPSPHSLSQMRHEVDQYDQETSWFWRLYNWLFKSRAIEQKRAFVTYREARSLVYFLSENYVEDGELDDWYSSEHPNQSARRRSGKYLKSLNRSSQLRQAALALANLIDELIELMPTLPVRTEPPPEPPLFERAMAKLQAKREREEIEAQAQKAVSNKGQPLREIAITKDFDQDIIVFDAFCKLADMTEPEVERAYKQLSRTYHPDKHADPKYTDYFQAVGLRYALFVTEHRQSKSSAIGLKEREIEQMKGQFEVAVASSKVRIEAKKQQAPAVKEAKKTSMATHPNTVFASSAANETVAVEARSAQLHAERAQAMKFNPVTDPEIYVPERPAGPTFDRQC